MALTTLISLKTHLSIPLTDTSEDDLLNQLIEQVSSLVISWLNQEIAQTTYTEYPEGHGTKFLRVKYTPLISVTSIYEDTGRVFAASSLLTAGVDYSVIEGQIYRLNGVWQRAVQNTFGLLYNTTVPSVGIYKVTYMAGYATTPADIMLHVNTAIAKVRATAEFGQVVLSERFEQYKYILSPLNSALVLDYVKTYLSAYRRITV